MPSEVLAKALSKLDEVVIQDGSLTATQLNDIFNKIASCDNLKLKHLGIIIIWESLGLTGANVRSVPPELFTESISRLEKVDFSGTDLTPAQTRAIFCLIAEKKSDKLRQIKLTDIDMDSVPDNLQRQAKENSAVKLEYSFYCDADYYGFYGGDGTSAGDYYDDVDDNDYHYNDYHYNYF